MIETIKTKHDLCKGCNRCVRECPMETANITYQDEVGDIKVKIDYEKCIACGRCVAVCQHDARYYVDDTEQFFNDLQAGIPISVIAAPSIRTNIPGYKKLFTWLKQLGINKIFDVSLGADICIWAHIRHIEKNNATHLITQPCPAIVTYCELYRHDLLPRLSPVHSPMACTSIYLKNYQGVNDRIAALSPCTAKKNEFEATHLAQYNITFAKLLEYLVYAELL
jgi:iron only hydrogenase large subunit-like protein